MTTHIRSIIKFHKAQTTKSSGFALYLLLTDLKAAMKGLSMSIKITDLQKDKYFLYSLILSMKSFIITLISYNYLLMKKGSLTDAILK